jgi:hypothetical protein
LAGHLALAFARADCDDRLVGEGGHHLDFAFAERLDAMARQNDDADWLAFAHERDADHRTSSADFCILLKGVSGIPHQIVDLLDVSAHRRTPHHGAGSRQDRLLTPYILGVEVAADLKAIHPFVQSKNLATGGVTQPYGRVDDGLQHRLQVEFRPADDAEEIGCGSLLLQQLISFTRQVADRAIRLSARQRPRCLDALGRRALAATALDRFAACSRTPFHFPARASSHRNRRDRQPGSA